MTYIRSTLLIAAFFALPATAQAQLVVLGSGDAAICYRQTLIGDQGSKSTIKTCTEGLSTALSYKDRAATHVNRGVLYMRRGDQERATKDFEKALSLRPNLTEAHINYAASLIRQEKLDAALITLNTALEDKDSKKRPEALYNRAIVLDLQDNFRGAYFDLKEALALRPDWEPAKTLISQYIVQPAG